MKDELVAVVDEAIAVDRLVVPDIHVAIEPRRCAGGVAIDRDRLDPVDRVLELQVMAGGLGDLERGPRVGRLRAHIEEQRSGGIQGARRRLDPCVRPVQIPISRKRVVVAAIADAEVIGR